MGWLELALQHCRAGLSDEFAQIAQLYIDRHDAMHDVWEEGAWCIVQGDGHWGNLFVDDGRIGFLDWGLMSYMPGMRDVSFFLCMGLDVKTRRMYERDLIAVYIDRIKKGGGPVLTAPEAWEMHRLYAAYTVPAPEAVRATSTATVIVTALNQALRQLCLMPVFKAAPHGCFPLCSP